MKISFPLELIALTFMAVQLALPTPAPHPSLSVIERPFRKSEIGRPLFHLRYFSFHIISHKVHPGANCTSVFTKQVLVQVFQTTEVRLFFFNFATCIM
jgi:hypothetical protein